MKNRSLGRDVQIFYVLDLMSDYKLKPITGKASLSFRLRYVVAQLFQENLLDFRDYRAEYSSGLSYLLRFMDPFFEEFMKRAYLKIPGLEIPTASARKDSAEKEKNQ